jgi:hypothetical protein
VSQSAKDILLKSDDFKNFKNDAIDKARIDIEQRCTKLTRRFEVQNKNNTETDSYFTDMINFEKLLLKGIENPSIKLDSIGMFFLSRFPIDEMDINVE